MESSRGVTCQSLGTGVQNSGRCSGPSSASEPPSERGGAATSGRAPGAEGARGPGSPGKEQDQEEVEEERPRQKQRPEAKKEVQDGTKPLTP